MSHLTLLLIFLLGAMGISFLCSILESVLMSTPLSYITMREDAGFKPAKRFKEYKTDNGKPIAEGTAELIAEHPEWKKEIELYYGEFMKMIGGQILGMEEYIKELKAKGFRVFGLSNWSEETFALVRPVYPVLNLMEDMVISGIERVMKPDPRIFQLALQRFGIKAEETAFIDDNPNNVAGANALGITGILFESKDRLEEVLKNICNFAGK